MTVAVASKPATKPAAKRAAKPTARTAKATARRRPTLKEETKTSGSTAQAEPQPTAVPETSPNVTADAKASRYADAAVAESIAARLSGVRVLGFTRPALAELTGLTPGAVWRAENRRVHPTEVDVVTAALDKIDRGEAQPSKRRGAVARGRAAELEARLDAVCRDLTAAVKDEKTVAALRKRVSAALAVLAD